VNRYRGPSIVECTVACLIIAVITFLFVRGTALCPVEERQHAVCMATAERIAASTAMTVTIIFALILLLGVLLRSIVKRR
jgi:hypothetical protein